jgi:hypothetical protein
MNPTCPKCGKTIMGLRATKLDAQDMFGRDDKIPMVAYACENGCNTLVGVTVDPAWLADQIAKRLG